MAHIVNDSFKVTEIVRAFNVIQSNTKEGKSSNFTTVLRSLHPFDYSTCNRIRKKAVARGIFVNDHKKGFVYYKKGIANPSTQMVVSLLKDETNSNKVKQHITQMTKSVNAPFDQVAETEKPIDPQNPTLADYSIAELVEELRNRNCEVTCIETIKKSY